MCGNPNDTATLGLHLWACYMLCAAAVALNSAETCHWHTCCQHICACVSKSGLVVLAWYMLCTATVAPNSAESCHSHMCCQHNGKCVSRSGLDVLAWYMLCTATIALNSAKTATSSCVANTAATAFRGLVLSSWLHICSALLLLH